MSLSRKIRAMDDGPGGLLVTNPSGREQLMMSAQEICDDVVATIPKLHAAVERDTYGRRWKQKRHQNGVDVFELDTVHSTSGGDEDLDIVHAVIAKVELQCHLNEVLSVLLTDDSLEYEATMKALCGAGRFKRGASIFSHRHVFHARTHAPAGVDSSSEHGHVSVKLATLRPKLRLKLKTTHKRTQKLVLASVTQRFPSAGRALHVVKTLPKAAHDQLVPTADRSALRRELDHIAVGFHLQSTHRDGGSVHQTTRVFAHGYASATPPSSFGKQAGQSTSSSTPRSAMHTADLAKRRDAIMNPEARNVLALLTKTLRSFERVIRRRRFGFQSFIYFPPGYDDDPSLVKSCSICRKTFAFYRRDFFCQLCGHMVCSDCSQLYEVEARIGDVRKNRACLHCVFRVDSCMYANENLAAALGPAVVDVDASAWRNDDAFYLAAIDEDEDNNDMDGRTTDDTQSFASDAASSSEYEELHEQLYSDDASLRSQALDFLGQLVDTATATSKYDCVDPAAAARVRRDKSRRSKKRSKKAQVLESVENHLSQSLRVLKEQYNDPVHCVVADPERDYALAFDAAQTRSPAQPLPPVPTHAKEAKRVAFIHDSGAIAPGYDRSALDLIAEVAAKRLKCPIGFISMVDATNFHAIGSYNLPPEALVLPRTNNVCIHQVYGEKPLVLKNPQCDMRFSQMPCVQDLGVQFYAGFPVYARDGSVVGSLCTADAEPHNNISTKDYATMEALARLVSDLVDPAMQPQAVAVAPVPSRSRQSQQHCQPMSTRSTRPFAAAA